jgi:BirA family biotin operon repressor/biotin-[acetyl-CoA-carboxylase] ligase
MSEPYANRGKPISVAREKCPIGSVIAFRPRVSSTNDVVKQLACAGAAEGLVVVADYQSEGRGRRDRKWYAPPGSSLLLSVLFRPSLAPGAVQQITMLCGLSVVDAIEEVTGQRASLKWPNDVLLEGAKLGGILTEVALSGQTVEYVVVGIGLNVNLSSGDLPSSILTAATSLSEAVRSRVSRWQLLGALVSSLTERYQALGSAASPYAEWTERLANMGEQVSISDADGSFQGIAEGVDSDGALRVRLGNGRIRRVLAGDVNVRMEGKA